MLFVFLRRHMKTILLGTIIVITPAFVMWGTGTGTGSAMSAAVALSINDHEVSPQEFARAVRNAERLVGPDQAVTVAIDTLLDEYVVRQACLELEIIVAPGEVQEELKQLPTFRNDDGSFNARRWNAMVRRNDAKWATNVAIARQYLQRQKLFDLLRATVQVSPAEIRARYEHDYARRRVAYATVDPATFTGNVTVRDADLETYFDVNQDQYAQPPAVRLAVVHWPKAPSEADTAEVHALLGDIERQLDAGADFGDLAEQYSQDSSATRGGDLGYFTRDRMVKPFADAAFAMQPGDRSAPVQSEYGWHIIQVEDLRESDNGPELRARHILIKEEPSIETLGALFDAASAFAAEVGGQSLAQAASAAGLSVTLTDPVSEAAQTLPGIGRAREVLTAAFTLEAGQRTSLLDLPEGFVLAEVQERIPTHVPAMTEVRARVEADYRLQSAADLALERATAVADAARSAGNLANVDANLAGAVTDTEFFTRVGFVPKLGRPPAFMEAAFLLQPGEVSEPVPHGQRWLVLQVREAAPADPEGLDTIAAPLRQQIEQARRTQAVRDFLIARKTELIATPNADILASFAGGTS